MTERPAARASDPIVHTSSLVGLISGGTISVAIMGIHNVLMFGVSGIFATIIGAAVGGSGPALAGAWIGEVFPTSPTGTISSGSPSVFVDGMPAARAGEDFAMCAGRLPFGILPDGFPFIAQGSSTVFINNMMAARKDDKMVCGASISLGSPTVVMGGKSTTVPGLEIASEIPPWLESTLSGVALGGTVIAAGVSIGVFGLPALVGIGVGYGLGLLGGYTGDLIGRQLGGEQGARIGHTIGSFGGSLLGGMLGGKIGGVISSSIRTRLGKTPPKLSSNRNQTPTEKITATGEPVDVATGKVFTEAADIRLPGPIPFTWERIWWSTSTYRGPLGHGWHHNYDLGLKVESDRLEIRLADGRLLEVSALKSGELHFVRREKLTVFRDDRGYGLRTAAQLSYRFSSSLTKIRGEHVLRSIEDRAGNRIECAYDTYGRLTHILDSGGRALKFSYDESQRLQAISIPHPNHPEQMLTAVQYAYSSAGDLIQVQDAVGQSARYAYRHHLLIQSTDRNGLSFYFDYAGSDENARCLRTHGDGGLYDHSLHYNEHARTTRVRNSLGHETVYTWNDMGIVEKTMDPHGSTHQRFFNEFGEVVQEVNPLWHRTNFTYDSRGNCTHIFAPDGTLQRIRYDDADQPVEIVDANGHTWSYRYDGWGNLAEKTDPLQQVTRYQYTRFGLADIINSEGHHTSFTYDSQGNLIQMITSSDGRYQWSYDRLGRRNQSIDAKGNPTSYERDALGRIVRMQTADGNLFQVKYNGEGQPIHLRDRNRDVRLHYYGLGQVCVREEAGVKVEYLYDTEEQLIGLRNEHGLLYRLHLNANGQVIEEQGFDGRSRTYERDRLGRMTTVHKASGRSSSYTYDLAGRVVVVKHSSGAVEHYAYRPDGALMKASNAAIEVRFERDALGRVVKEWQGEHWVASTYDKNNLRASMHSSLGAYQVLQRNPLGKLRSVAAGIEADAQRLEQLLSGRETPRKDDTSWEMSIERDVTGFELKRRLAGGFHVEWQRDALGRPVDHALLVGARTLRSRSYAWSPGHRIQHIVDSLTGTKTYSYDVRGRLTGMQSPEGDMELRIPDVVGNLFRSQERSDRVYGPSGELLESQSPNGVTRYTYDVDGNLIYKTTPDGKTWSYSWNAAGMLERVERPDGELITFMYDALGRRISKTFRGQTTRWVWDGNNPLHEWVEGDVPEEASSSQPVHSYEDMRKESEAQLRSHPPTGPPASVATHSTLEAQKQHFKPKTVITWLFEPESFTPMAKLIDGHSYAMLTDHLGTPLGMADAMGNLVWSADIHTEGQARMLAGDRHACPFRFPGQYEDKETGLHYNRFRYYDPESAAYLNPDPIGLAGGTALYAYVRDPLTWVDPLGLKPCRKPGNTDISKVGTGVEKVAENFGRKDATIFQKAAERAQDPKFLEKLPKDFSPTGSPNFDRDLGALSSVVAEEVPGGQVFPLGTMNGNNIFGTPRSGLGIVNVNGTTMVVQAPPGKPIQILGEFLP